MTRELADGPVNGGGGGEETTQLLPVRLETPSTAAGQQATQDAASSLPVVQLIMTPLGLQPERLPFALCGLISAALMQDERDKLWSRLKSVPYGGRYEAGRDEGSEILARRGRSHELRPTRVFCFRSTCFCCCLCRRQARTRLNNRKRLRHKLLMLMDPTRVLRATPGRRQKATFSNTRRE